MNDKVYPRETKEELLMRLEELRKKNNELEQQLANERNVGSAAGWLIVAPNPLYSGVIYGVQFLKGQAFIPRDRVIEAFVVKPMKETELAKYPAAEQAAIKERQNISSAERCVNQLVNDYGYVAEFFDSNMQGELKARMEARNREYNMVMESNMTSLRAQEFLQT
jgi:hypothetical protein